MDEPLLLVTKLHPPTVAAQTIARERLFERLREGAQARLTLVACPAGFGKSTLLAAWRETEPRPVAWVTLDEGDDDAVVLWSHVLEALARAVPELELPNAATAPIREVVLPRLVNALAAAPALVLVLDDFHRLTAADGVAWLVEHLPANTQLVLASRTDPELPLATLRARAQLLELRADDLRFTAPEAEEFLNDRLRLDLEPDDVALLVERTEGWPAGVYLAALSLLRSDDKRALIESFDGTSAHVVDFLAGEVLAAHPPHLQAFMLRTSVLERLCAPLCDDLLGEPGSADALEALARSNLFLIALDEQREWFRFHHLFAQLLRAELRRRDPDGLAILHRRAYAWHRASGTTDEAIRHALSAHAFEEAGELIAESWVHYVNSGRTRSVLDWLERMPDLRDPRLLLVRAWVSALVGDEGGMRAAAALVHDLGGLEQGPLPDGFGSLESSLSVLHATFGWGDAGAILAHGARSAELEGPDSPWRPVITWALGWAHYVKGDLDEAERWLEETTRIAPPAGQWIVGVAAIADLSLIAGLRGRREAQWRLANEARDLTEEVGLLDAIEDGEVHTAYGVALAARGEHDEAVPHLERGVFLRRLWGQKLDLIDGLIALASVTRSAEHFAEAEALVRACRDPGVLPARLAAARRPVSGEPLSERELEILQALAGGRSEREIANALQVSFNTVHSHVKAVYRKLGVSTRAEAVAHLGERARR